MPAISLALVAPMTGNGHGVARSWERVRIMKLCKMIKAQRTFEVHEEARVLRSDIPGFDDLGLFDELLQLSDAAEQVICK